MTPSIFVSSALSLLQLNDTYMQLLSAFINFILILFLKPKILVLHRGLTPCDLLLAIYHWPCISKHLSDCFHLVLTNTLDSRQYHYNFSFCFYNNALGIIGLGFWHCSRSMLSRVYEMVEHPFLHPSIPWINNSSGVLWVCCWAPCGQEILIGSGGCWHPAASALHRGILQQILAVSCWQPSKKANHRLVTGQKLFMLPSQFKTFRRSTDVQPGKSTNIPHPLQSTKPFVLVMWSQYQHVRCKWCLQAVLS